MPVKAEVQGILPSGPKISGPDVGRATLSDNIAEGWGGVVPAGWDGRSVSGGGGDAVSAGWGGGGGGGANGGGAGGTGPGCCWPVSAN